MPAGLPSPASRIWLAQRASRACVPYAYIAPAVVVHASRALAYPIVEAFHLLSSTTGAWERRGRPRGGSGSKRFREMLVHPQVWTSVGVTLAFVAIAVVAEMCLGIALALLLEKPVRGMRAFRTVFVLPMMIAPICVGLIWRYLFDAQFGPINHLVRWLGLAPQAWLAEPGLAFLAMVVTDVWQWTPFVFIMALAALQGMDASLIEAAKIDGASWRQVTFLVKLPMHQADPARDLLMRMIDAFRGLEVIYVMTFGGPGPERPSSSRCTSTRRRSSVRSSATPRRSRSCCWSW